MASVTLTEISARIHAHLLRFERDPKNVGVNGMPQYYRPSAYRFGPRAHVRYIAYQSAYELTRAEATAYLAWLDAGNVGRWRA